MTGTMVRVMMFHSSLTETGITGWMLRMFCVRLSGPTFRLVLFWNGTLIRLPTGFWASLASSSALSSARAGVAMAAVAIATTPAVSFTKREDMFSLISKFATKSPSTATILS